MLTLVVSPGRIIKERICTNRTLCQSFNITLAYRFFVLKSQSKAETPKNVEVPENVELKIPRNRSKHPTKIAKSFRCTQNSWNSNFFHHLFS